MRPVSSVSLRPPHSMDLRLISNILVWFFLLALKDPFPSGCGQGGTAFLFADPEVLSIRRVIEDLLSPRRTCGSRPAPFRRRPVSAASESLILPRALSRAPIGAGRVSQSAPDSVRRRTISGDRAGCG